MLAISVSETSGIHFMYMYNDYTKKWQWEWVYVGRTFSVLKYVSFVLSLL